MNGHKVDWVKVLFPLGTTVASGLACYVAWRAFSSWDQKRRLWSQINELRDREDGFRAILEEKLEQNAEKWLEIAELSFDELVTRLQTDKLKAIDALHAYQYAALIATKESNAVTQFIQNAEEIARKLDESKSTNKKPLHGVPFSLKETFTFRGTESTAGLAFYLGKYVDCETSHLVQFLIDQGAVPFIKTNIPQATMSHDSRNAIYGITRNPNDLTRSPGGSSSGEGAILSQHGSIIGIGTDIGGSVRIPAAWCGNCVALRPTAQRFYTDHLGPDGIARIITTDIESAGFMSRDVNSLVTLHRLYWSESTYSSFPTMLLLPFRDELYSSSSPLTIGYYTSLPSAVEAVPAMQRAVLETKALLESRGHRLVMFDPPSPDEGLLLGLKLVFADGDPASEEALTNDVEIAQPNKHLMFLCLPHWLQDLYLAVHRRSLGEFPTKAMSVMRVKDTPNDINLLYRERLAYQEKFVAAFKASGLDALLGPAFACPALPLDAPRDTLNACVYTALFNVLNWPAGVITVSNVTQADQDAMVAYPEHDSTHRVIKQGLDGSEPVTSSIGLPLAVQIASPTFSDEVTLRLLRELEQAVSSSSTA